MKKVFKITTTLFFIFVSVLISLAFSSCARYCVCQEVETDYYGNTYTNTEVYELEVGERCKDFESGFNITCKAEYR
jgi:outer membrane protein assembly factor BamE (lipoprotein component of BamABCDE complex)